LSFNFNVAQYILLHPVKKFYLQMTHYHLSLKRNNMVKNMSWWLFYRGVCLFLSLMRR